tara:strand:- start:251 stop:457 length:207 start_codon:yes stop_codon:yes gene_type:complete
MKEITLLKLRKLISKLNKDDRIVMSENGKPKKKLQLMEEVKKKGYNIDHEKEQLRPRVQMKRRKVIKL